jgi:hypothetical protein
VWVLLTMPVWNVLVGDTGSNIEHDDTTLAVDVITISQTTKLLLSSGIPYIEDDVTQVLLMISHDRQNGLTRTYGSEGKRMDLNTESGNVFLFEFTSQMTLDEGGLLSQVGQHCEIEVAYK